MSRQPVTVTQAYLARAARAGKQAGADRVGVRPDGTVVFLVNGQPLQPEQPEDEFTRWDREYEQAKAARRR